MWPWGHLAVAYLVYTVYSHRRDGRPPRALPVIALAVWYRDGTPGLGTVWRGLERAVETAS